MARGDAADLLRHGGREQGDLPAGRRLFEDPLHVIDEAHAQHFIAFIQDQGAQHVELQGAAAHMVHHASGRAHHHVHATLQGTNLYTVILAAVNRQDMKTLQVRGVFLECLGHLDGQFTGRHQHQHLRVFLL